MLQLERAAVKLSLLQTSSERDSAKYFIL